jgi:hypothetical protein
MIRTNPIAVCRSSLHLTALHLQAQGPQEPAQEAPRQVCAGSGASQGPGAGCAGSTKRTARLCRRGDGYQVKDCEEHAAGMRWWLELVSSSSSSRCVLAGAACCRDEFRAWLSWPWCLVCISSSGSRVQAAAVVCKWRCEAAVYNASSCGQCCWPVFA